MNKITMNKEYRTREGGEVRVLCIDGHDEKSPVMAEFFEIDKKYWTFAYFTAEGRYFSDLDIEDCPYDLIEVVQEDKMSENKEIKFQGKTRGGFDYVIYTTVAKGYCPIIGEVRKRSGNWTEWSWNLNGHTYTEIESVFDLIPIELQLKDKKVGDRVYAVNNDNDIIEWSVVAHKYEDCLWIKNCDRTFSILYDGTASGFGNGQRLFFATEKEARKSIEEREL